MSRGGRRSAGPSDDLGAGPPPPGASLPTPPRTPRDPGPLRGARPGGPPGIARGGDSLPHRGRSATRLQQMSQNVPDFAVLTFFPPEYERGHRRPKLRHIPRSPSFHGFGPRSEGGHRRRDLQEMAQDVPKCRRSPRMGSRSEGGPRRPGVRGVRPPRGDPVGPEVVPRARGRASPRPATPSPSLPLLGVYPGWGRDRPGPGGGRRSGSRGMGRDIVPGRAPWCDLEPSPVPSAVSSHTSQGHTKVLFADRIRPGSGAKASGPRRRASAPLLAPGAPGTAARPSDVTPVPRRGALDGRVIGPLQSRVSHPSGGGQREPIVHEPRDDPESHPRRRHRRRGPRRVGRAAGPGRPAPWPTAA